ncbi:MAG: hypothetical protein WC285_06210, partial [Candidatus Gracilibacteria bacterium]
TKGWRGLLVNPMVDLKEVCQEGSPYFGKHVPTSDGSGMNHQVIFDEVYRTPEELSSQDELLDFPWVFKHVFGKRVILGRA